MTMEVVSIDEFEQHQLRYQDRIMESAVDHLEALTSDNKAAGEMVVQFGDLTVDDDASQSPRLFDFDAPTTCRKWPGPRFGSFCLHKQIPKTTSKIKLSNRSSEKKRGLDLKQGARPRNAPTHRPRKSRTKASAPSPAILPSAASRIPPLRLKDLPAEVRNEIWTLLAVQKDPIQAQLRPIQLMKNGKKVMRRFPQEPLVAAVNKQLRKEVLSLFYGMNRFLFEKSAASLLKTYNMTQMPMMKRWQPRSDVAGFLTRVDVRFDLRGGWITYEISRVVDVLHIKVTSKKKSPTNFVCLCSQEAIAYDIKNEARPRTSDQEDLIEVAMAVARKRLAAHSTSALMESGKCQRCERDAVRSQVE